MVHLNIPKFTRLDGNSLLYNGSGSLDFYIPEFYFDKGIAIFEGEYIHIFGLFNYAISDSKGKSSELKLFNFPVMFHCIPGEIEKIKNVKLTKYSDPEDYRVLKFFKDNIIILNITPPQDDTGNIAKFLDLFNSGKLPNTIPYNEIHSVFLENAHINDTDYPINYQIIGLMIGELSTLYNDNTVLFSHTDMKQGYKMMNVKYKPKLISPFTSINSENFDDSVRSAMTISGKTDSISPVERLMTR